MATSALLLLGLVVGLSTAEESGAGSNCMGCFNATSGQCILASTNATLLTVHIPHFQGLFLREIWLWLQDTGAAGSCTLAQPSDCAAIGLPYANNSASKWPADGACVSARAAPTST